MRDGNILIGWGFATSTYPTNRQPASAKVRMDRAGDVVVQCGTQDIGTGTYTVMTQVAADALGVPMHRIRFELGDSRLPPAPVSGGSQTVASVAPSVQAACAGAGGQDQGPGCWPTGRGQSRDALQVRDGLVIGAGPPDRGGGAAGARTVIAFIEAEAQTAAGRREEEVLDARVRRPVRRGAGRSGPGRRSGSAASSARSTRGRILNAKTARSQLIGGITYGIGMALLEETLVDGETGRIVNPTSPNT